MSFDVDVTLWRGDSEIAVQFQSGPGMTVLVGRSGAGKTSVLNMIAGLLKPDRGTIKIGNMTLFDHALAVDVLPELRCAGYVFQEGRLFKHLRVRENLGYGRRIIPTVQQVGFPPRGPLMSSEEVVAFLGIGHLLDRWPRSLSGGEARRVAIGRALLSDPAFLLLDEPLASLDRPRRDEVMAALDHLRDHAGLPILLVTHDRAEAEALGAQVVEMG